MFDGYGKTFRFTANTVLITNVKDRALTNGNHGNTEFKNSSLRGEIMKVLTLAIRTYKLSNVNGEQQNFHLITCIRAMIMQFYMSLCLKKKIGFRPGPSQTGLCSNRRWLEA